MLNKNKIISFKNEFLLKSKNKLCISDIEKIKKAIDIFIVSIEEDKFNLKNFVKLLSNEKSMQSDLLDIICRFINSYKKHSS